MLEFGIFFTHRWKPHCDFDEFAPTVVPMTTVAITHNEDIEKAISKGTHADAVLVSAESFANLRRAYPNYFLDTKEFLAALKQAITL